MTEEEKIANRIQIGNRISELRQKKGMSVIQLAENCDVSRQNIYKIEDGKYNVSIDILYKVCKALSVELKIE